jgi:hypothetical protein
MVTILARFTVGAKRRQCCRAECRRIFDTSGELGEKAGLVAVTVEEVFEEVFGEEAGDVFGEVAEHALHEEVGDGVGVVFGLEALGDFADGGGDVEGDLLGGFGGFEGFGAVLRDLGHSVPGVSMAGYAGWVGARGRDIRFEI